MKRRISDIPESDRPRENLLQKGADALSDLELMAILLGTRYRGRKKRGNTMFKISITISIICLITSSMSLGDSATIRHFDRNSNSTGYSKKSPDGSITKYYDRNSNYTGYARDKDSKTKYYDSKEKYTGYSIDDPNRHITKYYDKNSSYTGYSTTDKAGKTRFYDRKGNYTGYYSDDK